MRSTKDFEFTTQSTHDVDAIINQNVVGKPALLAKLAKDLRFPDYFGGNWDALIVTVRT